MKIALTSDIHLEFGDWNPSNPEGADVLILGGDIMVAADFGRTDPHNVMMSKKQEQYRNFLDKCKTNYNHVIYIIGNHEHYHGDFATTKGILSEACDRAGVTLLDKETITIDDVTFIGGTLWTDMNNEDPMTLHAMSGMMNDFRCVLNSNREVNFKDIEGKFRTRPAKFSPDDAVVDHKAMLEYIRLVIEGKWDQKFVVVGHHAPSKMSTHPRYKDEYLMNGGYSSELSEFILDHPQIKAWTHGHTHEEFDYMIGSTRVMCNPRGYVNYERDNDENQPYLAKVFEV
jgi:Icc-related predicted phosphoesterase